MYVAHHFSSCAIRKRPRRYPCLPLPHTHTLSPIARQAQQPSIRCSLQPDSGVLCAGLGGLCCLGSKMSANASASSSPPPPQATAPAPAPVVNTSANTSTADTSSSRTSNGAADTSDRSGPGLPSSLSPQQLLRIECFAASGRVDFDSLACYLHHNSQGQDSSKAQPDQRQQQHTPHTFGSAQELRQHILSQHSTDPLGWTECKCVRVCVFTSPPLFYFFLPSPSFTHVHALSLSLFLAVLLPSFSTRLTLCRRCNLRMKKASFKAHCQKVHLRMGTMICHQCNKHFYSKHTFERHKNLHTGMYFRVTCDQNNALPTCPQPTSSIFVTMHKPARLHCR